MQNRYLFPLEFQKALAARQSNYTHLAKAMHKRGYRASKQFIGVLGLGQRRVPPELLRRICDTLELGPAERQRLHRAACLDMGFEIGNVDG